MASRTNSKLLFSQEIGTNNRQQIILIQGF